MKSSDKILKNIQQNIGNKEIELDNLNLNFKAGNSNLQEEFKKSLESVSAEYYTINSIDEAKNIISRITNKNEKLVNLILELDIIGIDTETINNPKDFYPLDIAIVKGIFGVAENGAIWILPGQHRIVPFICETLVAIINRQDLVADMHEAYKKLQDIEYDYGVFISGPSKTADIEQTLVIGAQGPSKMIVLIIND